MQFKIFLEVLQRCGPNNKDIKLGCLQIYKYIVIRIIIIIVRIIFYPSLYSNKYIILHVGEQVESMINMMTQAEPAQGKS